MKDTTTILAFYSFKGGVGRSMALVNSAFALAARGRHVLVLDMDLEAPGLSGFLHREKEIPRYAQCDILDLVSWARTVSLPLDPTSFRPATDYVVPIAKNDPDRIASLFSTFGRLDIIPADEERAYYDRLSELAIRDCDQQALVKTGSVLRAWLQGLRFPIEVPDYYGPDYPRSASYDYVLIDSRTGITEIGGLCIGPLSDQLVVLTAMNDQNVAGTRRFLIEVGVFGEQNGPAQGSKPCMIVASLVPAGEIEPKRERLRQIGQILGHVNVKLSYHPQLALKETIFTRDYKEEYLAIEYEGLTLQVLRSAGDWFDDNLLATTFTQPRSPAAFSDALTKLLRSNWSAGAAALLAHLLATTNFTELSADSDFALWDRVCQSICSGESSYETEATNNWANLLSEWALKSEDARLADLRFAAAMSRYEQILRSDEATPEQKAIARLNRGLRHSQRGQTLNALVDYEFVIQMTGAGAHRKAQAFVNRGAVFSQTGEPQKALTDFTAVIEMPGAPADQKALARLNRGTTYLQVSEPQKAIADYTSCIQLLDTLTERHDQHFFVHSFTPPQQGDAAERGPSHDVIIKTTVAPARREDLLNKSLLGRGVALKQVDQPDLAVADLTGVIEQIRATADEKCKAHLARGLTYGQLGESQKAVEDFTAVVRDFDPSPLEKASALICRGLVFDRLNQPKTAITDYGAVLEMSNAPADHKSLALVHRGLSYAQIGELERATEDFTVAIGSPNIALDQRATAQTYRGLAHGELGRLDQAISDFTAVSEMENLSPDERARALINRGVTHAERNELDNAIADYTAVDHMPSVGPHNKAKALFFRGICYSRRNERETAIIDFTTVIGLPNLPGDQMARALFIRGLAYDEQNEPAKAIADMSAVVQVPNDPGDVKANALFIRGSIYGRTGEFQQAIADFTRLVGLSNVSEEERAQALCQRGVTYAKLDRPETAISDYTAVIEMAGVSNELKSQVLYSRGAVRAQLRKLDDAIADYTAIIEMTGVPDERRCQALYSRGATHARREEPDKAIEDYASVINFQGASAKQRAIAFCSRGWLHFLAGRINEAIADEQQAISLNPEHWTAHANLALALLVSGETSDALAAYDIALGLSGAEGVDEMENDIRIAIEKYGHVSGTEAVITRLDSRRKLLRQ